MCTLFNSFSFYIKSQHVAPCAKTFYAKLKLIIYSVETISPNEIIADLGDQERQWCLVDQEFQSLAHLLFGKQLLLSPSRGNQSVPDVLLGHQSLPRDVTF